ncbi:MAG: hypothetical protein EoVTN8_142 [Fluviibacter phosphoraccumulans EoVTN8]
MKKTLVLLAVALTAVVAQPASADGRGHHYSGHRSSWMPFAAGAVLGGVVIGSMIQPQPVYAQPVYVAPPPPRVIVPRPYYIPAPLYAVPAPAPSYYYERY